ncbi:cell division cycle protein 16 homolog isoform X2 [Limulus polyphemus]|uniref:Cell division cycle protein 16 homolog isoform X2 n=1 Tax=Limulus polyphemus TaxID=6850 RepID=A0ABM1SYR1_LIMPO|nr:cell division cycle protein 16 homolog isoform X2 [Limulus polyphemus]
MEGERKELNVEEIPVSSLYDRDSTVPINLNKYRKAVKKYINKHHYHTALFWADKVVSLNNGDCQDIFWLAHCLFLTEQYHRAAYCIKSQNLHKVDLGCRYLAAKCHFAGKEYQEALATLDVTEANSIGPNTRNQEPLDKSVVMGDKNWESSIQLLKGQIHEAMDNRGLAAMCFREALHLDVYCYEAFHSLIHHQMLLKEEEKALMESLPFGKQCCEEESKIVRLLYETQLKKYDKPSEMIFPPQLESLENNLDIKTAQAERCYYNCDYQQCFKITSLVLNKDSFHSGCLPIHISCLMELQKSNDLFYFAHKLVDLYPEKAIAWFAVGCYYLLINKTDAARRYLSKATTLDRVFGPAWLVYGHSFAVENEHDQAMAAYFKASQLMKGCIMWIHSDICKMKLIESCAQAAHIEMPSCKYADKSRTGGVHERFCKKEWIEKYTFTAYSSSARGIFCLPCVLFPVDQHTSGQGQVLIAHPLTNWKDTLADLKKHSHLEYHLKSEARIETFVRTMNNPKQ